MPLPSMIGMSIGVCFLVLSLLLRITPINTKWLFTLYTKEQRVSASEYLSRLLVLVGIGFCIVALLPSFTQFRGLRTESFLILASLTLSLCWYFTKKHIAKIYPQNNRT